jgi:glycosyltransferase involved in cell wall biosynthesis
MRVAIVHDYLVQHGGAERVVEALHGMWPQAPVYTSVFAPDLMPPSFREMEVRTSFMQRLPVVRRRTKLGLPLYPLGFGSLDLSGFDVIVSSSSGWAHGVRVDPNATHVVYCHNPARWLYRPRSYVLAERLPAAPLLPTLRRWDRRAARRPHVYVANSHTTRDRILAEYGRHATVVHPPVDTARFSVGEPEEFFLCASRLTAYKRLDVAIDACVELDVPLVVAGDGPARRALERRARGRVEFLGRVSDRALASLLARCRALIVPGEEDFCITAVEAMASGRPVVGFARGGLLETVLPDRTGVLFASQVRDSLVGALVRLEQLELEPAAIRRHALRYDVRRFQETMRALVEEAACVDTRTAAAAG